MKKFTTAIIQTKKASYPPYSPGTGCSWRLALPLPAAALPMREVQRYSWPLATASPEDTVTQIFAEKFAEEVSDLSDGK